MDLNGKKPVRRLRDGLRRWSASAAPGPLLTFIYVATFALVAWVWAPWRDGSEGRVTSSGLIAVLTLVIVQFGTTAIQARSQNQAISLRSLELEAERENRESDRDRSTVETAQRERRQAAETLGTTIVDVIPVLVDMEMQEEYTHEIPWPSEKMASLSTAIFKFRFTFSDLAQTNVVLNQQLGQIEMQIRSLNESATHESQRRSNRQLLISSLGGIVRLVSEFQA